MEWVRTILDVGCQSYDQPYESELYQKAVMCRGQSSEWPPDLSTLTGSEPQHHLSNHNSVTIKTTIIEVGGAFLSKLFLTVGKPSSELSLITENIEARRKAKQRSVLIMAPGGEYVDDDGYFTCAVSVQHKVRS